MAPRGPGRTSSQSRGDNSQGYAATGQDMSAGSDGTIAPDGEHQLVTRLSGIDLEMTAQLRASFARLGPHEQCFPPMACCGLPAAGLKELDMAGADRVDDESGLSHKPNDLPTDQGPGTPDRSCGAVGSVP